MDLLENRAFNYMVQKVVGVKRTIFLHNNDQTNQAIPTRLTRMH